MSLIDTSFVKSVLNHEAPWSESHDSSGDYLGLGMLYYSLAYSLRARVAVCLGSGGGFVPRVLRQAQRDLAIPGSSTILVDANLPEAGWGAPQWLDSSSFFRVRYPEVRIIQQRTDDAIRELRSTAVRAELIHIDADHSYQQVRRDFENYSELLAVGGVISLHDTGPDRVRDIPGMGVPRLIREIRRSGRWDVLEFSEIAAGTAVVRRRPQRTTGLWTRVKHRFRGH